ncbi:SusC/RagA family TonB-linked outer membrane protein [Mucilaginibacter sp. SG564]|uniref:SusC/RagA family TonB-linked outer membrane protein n=1 Tax=Mucilaginibacter sp. SG564 TaxID=2587022 RepID=UPI001555FEE9|nr:SusC/RagA family TonB-linked outer membrane protein [Mucilaginibacter sp. SG564]NOW95061.1 TonB-linked SusC/RagA family outer membrane protein [Mucilaginibacter sp. SG564]
MKLSTLILLIGLLHASAKGFSQVSLNENHAKLADVLKKIEKQTKYVFIYDEDKLQVRDIVVKVDNATIQNALNACFQNQPVTYSITGNTVILRPAETSVFQKIKNFLLGPVHINGIITDSAGTPLSRATVSIIRKRNASKTDNKGTIAAVSMEATGEISFVTNDDGRFQIDAEEGDELAVSFVGFQTYRFTAKTNMPFQKIALQRSTSLLKDVIVHTGYQTLSKERATGSFSKPDMQVLQNRSSTMDLVGRLEGQIPGMVVAPFYPNGHTVNQTTGTVTQQSIIRGASSIHLSTDPLYVVNGVIVPDFGSLNVDDIADVTVLKDAAAAAIWGAKAANGVVVVVTKSGSKNQKIKVSYRGFINFEGRPDLDYARKFYLNSSQYIQVAKQIFDPTDYPYSQLNSINNYYGPVTPSQQVLYNQNQGIITASRANAQLDSMSKINNSKQIRDLLYRNAFTTNHVISASGGTNTYTVYGSLGYTDTHSSTLGQTGNSYKLNLSQSFTPNDRFSFSLISQLANNVNRSPNGLPAGPDVLPYQLLKDANGNNINMPFLSGWTPEVIKQYSDASGINLGTYQIFDEQKYATNKTNSYEVNVVGNATVKFFKGLQYLGTYGYSIAPTEMQYIQDNRAYSYRKQLLNNTLPGSPPTYLIPQDGEFYQLGNNNQRNWTVRNQLVYNYSGRNGNDYISLQGGQEARELVTDQNKTTIYGYNPQLESYPLLDYNTLNQGVFGTLGGYGGHVQQPFSAANVVTRNNSYFAMGSYTRDHKYSLDLSWRVDHSNVFGSDVSAQNKPTYSLGGKWNIKNEKFLSSITWIDALSVRGTYGITGNSPYVGAASTNDIIYTEQIPNYQYAVIGGPAYQISQAADKALSWEATHTTNIGVDFAILNNRLSGSIEYYHKSTTDLLGSAPVNFFTGSTSSTANLGDLVNNGINIGLNSININTEHFTWQSGFVFGYNQNKLVKYQIPASYESYPSFKLGGSPTIGFPINSLFAYKYAGLDKLGDPQVYLANGKITKDPNVTKGDDLVYMGTTTPKFNGGLTNNFRYKQFQLSLNMTYSLGAVMRRTVNQFYSGLLTTNSNLGGNISNEFLQRWQKPGDENVTAIPRYLSVENYGIRNLQYYEDADINVVSASYVKLNEAALIYNLSPGALRWLKIQSASLRVQVNNILLWKANKYGLNPEFQNYQYGTMAVPVGQHTITLGANVNF